MSSTPFLYSESPGSIKCLLCNNVFNKSNRETVQKLTGLSQSSDLVKRWNSLDIGVDDDSFEFTNVSNRISSTQKDYEVHKNCRITFFSSERFARKERKYGQKDFSSQNSQKESTFKEQTTEVDSSDSFDRRSSRKSADALKEICFICNQVTKTDGGPYNSGGLGRCSDERASIKLNMSIQNFGEGHKFHEAAQRLMVLKERSFDIFAADIFYHKDCYSQYIRSYSKTMNDGENQEESFQCSKKLDEIKDNVSETFFRLFSKKVIAEKEAYLLTELLIDIEEMSYDAGLDKPIITQTSNLKRKLEDLYDGQIGFEKVNKKLLVYPLDVNPCFYVTKTLGGAGLRDHELTKAFARMINRKLLSQGKEVEWPITAEELLKELETFGPLQCIYNALAWSKNPSAELNEHGYVNTPNETDAEKMWAISSDWESLVTKQRSIKSTALSLTIHRLTGSKEVSNLLHRCGHGISYTDIRLVNNSWAHHVTRSSRHKLPKGFQSGIPIHISIDNSDGKQQTLTGAHTTHHTNGTVFQLQKETFSNSCTEELPEITDILLDNEDDDYGTYKITKKDSPPPITTYNHKKTDLLLKWALKRDIAWVLVSAVGKTLVTEDLEPVGSWTNFMKKVTPTKTNKCFLEYLEVVPMPPGDNVCKWYLDTICKMIDDLAADCVFLHADEAVYCKVMMIKWDKKGKYDKIIPIIGGFHTLCVKLKILHKKYGVLGMKEWWIDAGAIVEGSAEKAADGRHYFRGIRCHKQSFEALLRYKILKYIDIDGFTSQFKEKVCATRRNPGADNLSNLIIMEEFQSLVDVVLGYTGTMSQMIIEYLKDVSSLLSMVSSVREMTIERHLEAERAFLPQLFAFGHPNYARYLTYQHVMLSTLSISNLKAWDDLKNNGFGGSISGEPFSTKHGDLIIETTINRDVKVRGGPMQGGYSTNQRATNTFVKTTHLMAKLRAALKSRLHLLTSSKHKETSLSSIKQHEATIQQLTTTLDGFLDPFSDVPAMHMKRGEVIDEKIVEGLLKSTETGEALLKEFIEKRLTATGKKRISIFKPIKNPKIETGLKKKEVSPKVINVLKEEKQAFGLLVGKSTTAEEAHSYPLTSVPLALAQPDGGLRQSSKATFRNYIIEEGNATEYFRDYVIEDSSSSTQDFPSGADWIVDGMAALHSVAVRNTWREFAEAFLAFCIPPPCTNAKSVIIVMDTYDKNRIKEMTQKSRGTEGKRILITGEEQKMPTFKDWSSFLHNGENKTGLISFLADYYKKPEVREKLSLPLIITEGCHTWSITKEKVEALFECNHDEADTRIVLHASQSSNPVIVVASDTDIFLLLAYAYTQIQISCNGESSVRWFMKIDNERHVNINLIYDFYGADTCNVLPAIHCITGCDTTSFPFGCGKVKPFKRMLKQNKQGLLTNFGTILTDSDETFHDAIKFLQTVVYNGKESESLVQTRISKYEKQKNKSSLSLIPDRSSCVEHLKRACLQTNIWLQCMLKTVVYGDPLANGWQQSGDGLKPLWFTCSQLPPSLTRGKGRKRKIPNENVKDDVYEADDESDVDASSKRIIKIIMVENPTEKLITDIGYEADNETLDIVSRDCSDGYTSEDNTDCSIGDGGDDTDDSDW